MTLTVCDNETIPVHRVMEEIEEVVGDKTTVEADDLDKLTYMNQVPYRAYFSRDINLGMAVKLTFMDLFL